MTSLEKYLVEKIWLLMVLLGTFVGSAQAQLVPNDPPVVLSVPGTYNYAHSFTNVSAPDFLDYFAFTITPANLSTAATSISLDSYFGLSNLRATLYSGFGPFTGASPTLLSNPAWSTTTTTVINPGVTLVSTQFSLASLAAGDYTLAIKGKFLDPDTNAATTGGTYSGVLNLTTAAPVPEPSQGLALLAGLGLLGFQLRRKTKDRI